MLVCRWGIEICAPDQAILLLQDRATLQNVRGQDESRGTEVCLGKSTPV